MTKVVAIMSMSLDGYVADANDGIAEVFDWYFSGDVEVSTASTRSGMTFHVSAPSADHLRGLTAEVGAMLTGRRTFERADGWDGQHPWDVPAFVVTHYVPDGWPRPGSTVQFVTDGIESAVARAKSAARPKSATAAGHAVGRSLYPRLEELRRGGCEGVDSVVLAGRVNIDLRQAVDLVERGCPPDLALRILL